MLPPSNPHGSLYILPLYLSQCSHTAFTCLLQSWWPSSALHTSTTAHSPYLAHDHAPALLVRSNNTCHGLQPVRPSHLIASHQACQQDYVVAHVISNTSVEADLYSSSSIEHFFFFFNKFMIADMELVIYGMMGICMKFLGLWNVKIEKKYTLKKNNHT